MARVVSYQKRQRTEGKKEQRDQLRSALTVSSLKARERHGVKVAIPCIT